MSNFLDINNVSSQKFLYYIITLFRMYVDFLFYTKFETSQEISSCIYNLQTFAPPV